MGNPEPNPIILRKINKGSASENNKKRIGAETQWKLF